MGGVLVDEPHVLLPVLADDVGFQHLAGNAPRRLAAVRRLRHLQLLLDGSGLRRGKGRIVRACRLRHRSGGYRLRFGSSLLTDGAILRCVRRRNAVDNALPPAGGGEGFPGLRCGVPHLPYVTLRRSGGLYRFAWRLHRRHGGRKTVDGGTVGSGGADGPAADKRQLHALRGGSRLPELPGRHGLVEGLLLRRRGLPLPIQCVLDGIVYRVKYGLVGQEFHHGLGGVDVDIHLVHRQRNVEDAAGEPALQQPVAVGLLHGGGQELALDKPAVDEE